MENKPLVAIEPAPDLWMLMGGVVVEDDVDGLVRRDLSVDHVQEPDELLVPVVVHIASDNCPVEDVQGGEECRGSVALVVVGHSAQTPLLHGQARLGAVERLDLAFLVYGQDDGVGGRIDVKPNDIAQFADEVRVVRELELPIAVRLQAMGTPDAPDRAFTDAGRRGHHRGRPMGRLDGRVRQRQRHHAPATSGPKGGMRDGRVLSRRRPSMPSSMNRSCQRQTQVFDVPVRRMISCVPTPSALKRMIAARHTCFCAALRSLTTPSRRRRSEEPTVMEIPVRMRQTRKCARRWESPKRTLPLGGDH